MSNFKIKHDKVKHSVQIHTLDETHKQHVSNFRSRKFDLPNKKEKLESLRNELRELELSNPRNYTIVDIKRKAELKTDIKNIEDDIYDIENDLSELDYYFKTEDIIMDYYQLVDNDDDSFYVDNPDLCNEKNGETIETSSALQEKKPDRLDLLNQKNRDKRKPMKVTKKRKNAGFNNSVNILNFLVIPDGTTSPSSDTVNSVKNKATLMNSYMMLIDSEYTKDKQWSTHRIIMCENCNIEKILFHSDGTCVCSKCGEVDTIIIDSDKPNYKDISTDTKRGYPYKRHNHLNEWLSQFQAKESVDIPDEVYSKIIAEFKKNRITDMKSLNVPFMKKILKSLGLTNYYEHTPYIISRLSGIPPPTINRETEEKIRLMFRQVQVPFEKYCPKDRVNFLSYSYALHKFFQLLELDDFVKCFPLLKNGSKLKQQDMIWEKICRDLNWDYYPSI